MELMVTYVIGGLLWILTGGSQKVAAIVAGYKQGDVVRDPVPVVHAGEFMFLPPNESRSPVTTHTHGNCESCGSQEFRTHRGVAICSYCRSVA